MKDETVRAGEELVSVFEPHTAIIDKGKAGKPTEFGHVLWLAKTEDGIIDGTWYCIQVHSMGSTERFYASQ